jgi:hypothetical protein
MQVPKLDKKSETKPTGAPVQGSRPISKFDDAEYERWSELLRRLRLSKDK